MYVGRYVCMYVCEHLHECANINTDNVYMYM